MRRRVREPTLSSHRVDGVRSSRHTTRTRAGTAEYVSPEVLEGESTTTKCDLWALGCLVFQLSTGRLPFTGATDFLVWEKIVAFADGNSDEVDFTPVSEDVEDLVRRLCTHGTLYNDCVVMNSRRTRFLFVRSRTSARPELVCRGRPSRVPTRVNLHSVWSTCWIWRPGAYGDNVRPVHESNFHGAFVKSFASTSTPSTTDACSIACGSSDMCTGPYTAGVGDLCGKYEEARGLRGLEKSFNRLRLGRGLIFERVVAKGILWKRKGLFWRERVFLLTSAPRLVYYDASKKTPERKGVVEWPADTPPKIRRRSPSRFDVCVAGRDYHLAAKGDGDDSRGRLDHAPVSRLLR